ncbi:MAG: RNA methyltransferase [Epsilonproteobacteria bacterium]|nr:RNA methyltransferase [Campylobacterota bacterium]
MKKQVKKKIEGEILYGAHPIIEMLKAKKRKLISIYTTKKVPKAWDRIAPHLPKRVPNIQYVERSVLDRLAGSTEHMGVVAWVTPFRFCKAIFTPDKKPLILLLDAVQDVRNFGAILRSAYCMGINGVVICKKDSAPLNASVFKASAGLAEYLDIHLAPSMAHAVTQLKQNGYEMYMAVLDGVDATQVSYHKGSCLVIGNEATGIAKNIRKEGTLITLPQRNPEISYNASVASALLMFTVAQKMNILPKI